MLSVGKKIRYLGVEIDAEGIHVLKDRVEAINRAPHPKNIKELQAFLETINYYGKFVRDRSTKLHLLHECLKKKTDLSGQKTIKKRLNKHKKI